MVAFPQAIVLAGGEYQIRADSRAIGSPLRGFSGDSDVPGPGLRVIRRIIATYRRRFTRSEAAVG
jgi:hypothetical protein